MESSPSRKHQFQTLDALRGIAAIFVVILHAGARSFPWQPHFAYLAVDLFFVLSGFVLSFAYQQRLDAGLSTATFLKLRLIRLAPLYFLANLFGLAVNAYLGIFGPIRVAWPAYLGYFIAGNLFIPVPGAISMFPLVQPAWTLLLELIANLAHALFWRRRGLRFLLIVCSIAGICFGAAVFRFQSENIGWMGHHSFLLAGIPRVVFSYTAGMCLYRAYSGRGNRVPGTLPRVPAAAVLALAAFALWFNPPHDLIAGLFLIYCVLPALVYLGTLVEPGPLLRGTFGVLGTASYAIYVLHWPAVALLNSFRFFQQSGPVGGLLLLAALVAASLLLDRFWDTPLRQALRRLAS